MTGWRTYVEGFEVDGGDDLSAQFTYAIDDIKDYATRNTAFSKTIVLPGTARNNKTFGHIFDVGNGNFYNSSNPNVGYNFNAAKGAKCVITQDHIPIFKGIIRIMAIVIDNGRIEYETAVFGELGGLINAIGDKKLENLDFIAYNHTFNAANISASWSATRGAGYVYPHIDTGYTTDGVNFPIENFRPALYVKEYIDKIFANAGYTYDSTFLNSTFFKKLIIPSNQEKLYTTVTYAFDVQKTTAAWPGPGYTKMQFNTIVANTSFEYNGFKDQFTYQGEENLPSLTGLLFNWTRVETTAQTISVKVMKNGAVAFIQNFATGAATSGHVAAYDSIYYTPTDFVEVYVSYSGTTFTPLTPDFSVQGQPTLDIPASAGVTITMNRTIPRNIYQKDFLAWLIKMFNLYIDEDNVQEKHLKIEPYVNYYQTSGSDDWDSKLDKTQPIRLTPMGELTSRFYEYKYKDDSDYYNDYYKKKFGETYGTFYYDTGLELVKDKTTVEIGFSPTVLVQYTGTDRVIPSIVKRNSGTGEPPFGGNIRIMVVCAAPLACQQWTINTHTIVAGVWTNTATNYTTYCYAGHLDDPDAPTADINFGAPKEFYFTIVAGYLSANLFNVYWSFYISEITDKDSKVLEGFFKLTPADIYALDFSKLKWILGQLWRVNKVIDYSTDQPELTKCELLKVIDIQ